MPFQKQTGSLFHNNRAVITQPSHSSEMKDYLIVQNTIDSSQLQSECIYISKEDYNRHKNVFTAAKESSLHRFPVYGYKGEKWTCFVYKGDETTTVYEILGLDNAFDRVKEGDIAKLVKLADNRLYLGFYPKLEVQGDESYVITSDTSSGNLFGSNAVKRKPVRVNETHRNGNHGTEGLPHTVTLEYHINNSLFPKSVAAALQRIAKATNFPFQIALFDDDNIKWTLGVTEKCKSGFYHFKSPDRSFKDLKKKWGAQKGDKMNLWEEDGKVRVRFITAAKKEVNSKRNTLQILEEKDDKGRMVSEEEDEFPTAQLAGDSSSSLSHEQAKEQLDLASTCEQLRRENETLKLKVAYLQSEAGDWEVCAKRLQEENEKLQQQVKKLRRNA